MENNEASTSASSKGSLRFFVVLFILSMALNAFLFFRYAKKGMMLEKENIALTELLEQNKLHADSLQLELDRTIAALEDKLNANLAIKDISDDYRVQLENKIVELQSAKQQIASLIAQGNGSNSSTASLSSLNEAKQQIDSLRVKNTRLIDELDETKRLYAIARDAVDQYSMSSQEYKQKLDSLVQRYQTLNEGLKDAKTLRITDLNVYPERKKGEELEPTFKASKVDHIKVSFTVQGSTIVPKEEKELKIRILGTSGEVLSDNVDQLTNSDELVSMTEIIDYRGTEQSAAMYFKQKARYRSGKHKIEVWLNEQIIETKEFILF